VEPVLHRAATLRAAGYGEDDVRRLLRTRMLTPVRRGAYVERSPDDRDARHLLLLQAALADAALRAAGRTEAQVEVFRGALDAALRRSKGWPGAPQARRVVAFADGRAESVGESRSRVAIARAGLPVPELQRPVLHAGGTASADFGWPQHRTVGEFDGKAKYQRMLRPGQTPADAVYEEKLREDAIRAQGWEVVRWHWADLRDFAPTAASIRDRFRA